MLLASSGDFGLSYILEVVALVFVGLFIWRKVLPPLNKAMQRREQTIGSQLAAGEEAKAAGLALVEQRRQELEQARQEASVIIEQARRSALVIVEDGQRRAVGDHERSAARAEAEVEAAYARTVAEILAELSEVILSATTEVVEAELDQDSQRRLIDETIAAAELEPR